MQNTLADQWAELSRSALDSMKELGQINAKMLGKLSEQQQSILSTCLEASSKEMDLLSSGKDSKDLLKAQSKLAAEYNKKLVAIVRDTNKVLTDCKNELKTWIEKTTEEAVSKMQKS